MERFENLTLKHTFTKKELDELANQIDETISEKAKIQNEATSSAANYKALIKQKEGDIWDLSSKRRDGYEFRNHACKVEIDIENRKKVYIDKETGKVLKREDLSKDFIMADDFSLADGEAFEGDLPE